MIGQDAVHKHVSFSQNVTCEHAKKPEKSHKHKKPKAIINETNMDVARNGNPKYQNLEAYTKGSNKITTGFHHEIF